MLALLKTAACDFGLEHVIEVNLYLCLLFFNIFLNSRSLKLPEPSTRFVVLWQSKTLSAQH